MHEGDADRGGGIEQARRESWRYLGCDNPLQGTRL